MYPWSHRVYILFVFIEVAFCTVSLSYFDDATLRNLASEVGSEWPKLASYLGITSCVVDRLIADNKTTEECVFRMLVTWRQRSIEDGNTTSVHLQNALRNAERCDLAGHLEGKQRNNFVLNHSATKGVHRPWADPLPILKRSCLKITVFFYQNT